ncbi:MAG: DUF1565 domain-containing protein [Planctomycetota bacterium]|nr:MAG: DUF1565 domain-containing protein [Planctomycetota bacterium]
MRRFPALLCVLLPLAAPAAAQTTWYVDPVNGDDAATGLAGDPWLTVTHAMTVAASGDRVELKDGVFSAATNGESFPIVLVDGVDLVYPGSDHAAVFDAAGTTSVFRVNSVFADGGTLQGLRLRNCTIGVEVASGGGALTHPLDVDDCLFESFSVAAVRALLDAAGSHVIWVRNSALSPSSAPHGVRLQARGTGTVLAQSVVSDCTITNCQVGVAIEASDGGIVLDTCEVRRNDISVSSSAGIEVSATASAARDASNGVLVQSNQVTSGGVGLRVLASSTSGRSAVCDGEVKYNLFSGNTTNVSLETENNGFSTADLTCPFTGNTINGSTGDGIAFVVTAPASGGVNCLPDLGTAANGTGRNTFKNAGGFNLALDPDMANYLTLLQLLPAEGNFWGTVNLGTAQSMIDYQGVPQTLVDLDPILFDLLSMTVSPGKVAENTPSTLTVRAKDANTGFVDNDDPDATIGQMIVAIRKGATSITVDPAVFADGTGFIFDIPALADEGTWAVDVALPGGQAGSANFRVTTVGGGGGNSTGCFVATAAHGDYDAPEVRVLRRFRDDYLLAGAPGRSFVRAYYEYGPKAASWIEGREWARRASRAALAAPVLAAEGLLRSHPADRFAAAVLVLGGLFWLFRRRR